jgi:group I intron endonuclease
VDKNKKHGVVYKITNLINGKIYVGQTIKEKPINRFYEHICYAKTNPDNMIISKAINKYGKENFKFEVIDTAYTKTELNILEAYWIDELKSHCKNHGYNVLKPGLDGGVSEETRKMLSERAKNPNSQLALSKYHKKIIRSKKSFGKVKTKYIGVEAKRDKWSPYIIIDKKRYRFGCYDKEIDAAYVSDMLELKYGKTEKLNFPELKDKYLSDNIIAQRNLRYSHEGKYIYTKEYVYFSSITISMNL